MTRQLLLLNGFAVAAAVVFHSVGWGFTSLFWWTDRYREVAVPNFAELGGTSYYALRVAEQVVCFGVPAFLFVSGFFVAFAAGRQGTIGLGKVGPRVRMLIVPYVVWTTAIFVARALEGRTLTPGGYASHLLFGRAAQPFYFVPLLVQLYLLSPAVAAAARRHWKGTLLSAATVQLAIQVASYPVLLGWDAPLAQWISRHSPSWFFPHLVFWFVLGVVAGANGPVLIARLAAWKPLLPWMTAALALAGIVEWELLLRASGREWLAPTATVIDGLYALAVILTFLAYAPIRVPAKQMWQALGERSFGVYLMHAPVLEFAARGLYHAVPATLEHQAVFQTLLVGAGLLVPIAVMATVNRSAARSSYNYLFG